jgi:hypothetical protein
MQKVCMRITYLRTAFPPYHTSFVSVKVGIGWNVVGDGSRKTLPALKCGSIACLHNTPAGSGRLHARRTTDIPAFALPTHCPPLILHAPGAGRRDSGCRSTCCPRRAWRVPVGVGKEECFVLEAPLTGCNSLPEGLKSLLAGDHPGEIERLVEKKPCADLEMMRPAIVCVQWGRDCPPKSLPARPAVRRCTPHLLAVRARPVGAEGQNAQSSRRRHRRFAPRADRGVQHRGVQSCKHPDGKVAAGFKSAPGPSGQWFLPVMLAPAARRE